MRLEGKLEIQAKLVLQVYFCCYSLFHCNIYRAIFSLRTSCFYFYYFINLFTIFYLFLELVYGTCNEVVPVEFIVTIILYGLWGGGSWHETATKVFTANTAFSTLYYMNFLTKSGQFLICLMVKSHYRVLVIRVQNWTWCNAGTIVFLSLMHTTFQETLPEFAFQNY